MKKYDIHGSSARQSRVTATVRASKPGGGLRSAYHLKSLPQSFEHTEDMLQTRWLQDPKSRSGGGLDGSGAAPGRRQVRETILMIFQRALGASGGGSLRDLGKLLGALGELFGHQIEQSFKLKKGQFIQFFIK